MRLLSKGFLLMKYAKELDAPAHSDFIIVVPRKSIEFSL
jgi:hypothetical protein